MNDLIEWEIGGMDDDTAWMRAAAIDPPADADEHTDGM
jgi:hypothetical protein